MKIKIQFIYTKSFKILVILKLFILSFLTSFLLLPFIFFHLKTFCARARVCVLHTLWRHYKQPPDGIRLHIFFTLCSTLSRVLSSGWPSFACSITLELVNGGIFVIHRKYRLIPVNEQTNNVSKLPATEWITNILSLPT